MATASQTYGKQILDLIRIKNIPNIILPADENGHADNVKGLKTRGIFHECADISMINGEKGAWERAVLEKYEKENHS